MFNTMTLLPVARKRGARKVLRLRREDEKLIKAAAKAAGMRESDFIVQASLKQAEEVQRNVPVCRLPLEAYEAFKADVEAPGEIDPGLSQLMEESKGLLKNV